jgi:hypothetical protein
MPARITSSTIASYNRIFDGLNDTIEISPVSGSRYVVMETDSQHSPSAQPNYFVLTLAVPIAYGVFFLWVALFCGFDAMRALGGVVVCSLGSSLVIISYRSLEKQPHPFPECLVPLLSFAGLMSFLEHPIPDETWYDVTVRATFGPIVQFFVWIPMGLMLRWRERSRQTEVAINHPEKRDAEADRPTTGSLTR